MLLEIFIALYLSLLALSFFLKRVGISSRKSDILEAEYIVLSEGEPLFAEDSDFVQ